MKLNYFAAAALLGAASMGAQAGAVLVIDPKAIAEAEKQVASWNSQYKQMEKQIGSITGDRGMARLLSASIPVLPADWQKAMQGISPLAAQIKAAQAVLTPAQMAALPKSVRALVEQTATQSAVNQATAQVAYNDAAIRQGRLQKLIAALAGTTDLKAASDLGNAIAIERGYM